MVIGITGGTGCGKSTLLELIREMGGLVLDCDQIYHRLLQTDKTLLEDIGRRFPGAVRQGVLDRKALGAMVFSDSAALKELNRITHSRVKEEVLRALETRPALAAIDAIGLFEGALAPLCHVTVAVTAPTEDRVRRLMARDGIPEDYARMRIAAQKSNEEFSRLCRYTLCNDATPEAFRGKCLAFLRQLDIIEEKSLEKE